jgi:hypothetical protein
VDEKLAEKLSGAEKQLSVETPVSDDKSPLAVKQSVADNLVSVGKRPWAEKPPLPGNSVSGLVYQ